MGNIGVFLINFMEQFPHLEESGPPYVGDVNGISDVTCNMKSQLKFTNLILCNELAKVRINSINK